MGRKILNILENIMYGAIFITSLFVKLIMYLDQYLRLTFRKLFNKQKG